MQIVDSEGRLFGRVNVIDAFVVVVVLAVLVSGVGFVVGQTSDVGGPANSSPNATETRPVQVLVETTVNPSVARAIQPGDRFRVNGTTLADVDAVRVFPIVDSSQRRVRLNMTLVSNVTDEGVEFRGSPPRLGTTIPFRTEEYALRGTIVGQEPNQSAETVAATLVVNRENVEATVSKTIVAGMREQHRGATVRVANVTRTPSKVVLQTTNGTLVTIPHPTKTDVSLTLSARVQRRAGQLFFHGRQLRIGNRIVLDFGTLSMDGQVKSISLEENTSAGKGL